MAEETPSVCCFALAQHSTPRKHAAEFLLDPWRR
jgi:hypothetical protein